MYLWLGACSLGADSLGQPILDLATHSLHWLRGREDINVKVLGVEGLQSGDLHSGATDC